MKNRVASILLAVALILGVGLVGCGGEQVPQYNLTISSTEGGEITTLGDGTFGYEEGTEVPLMALPHTGYRFANWTGDVSTIANINAASTTITMNGDYSITANFAIKQHDLVIRSTEGGSVTTPGEGAFIYDEGEVVTLVAVADGGYQFIDWTGDISTIADVNAASTTITMDGHCITANFAKEIYDWHDLDAMRDNLDGNYILMSDLDSNTAGYTNLASRTANGGSGWRPIAQFHPGAISGSFDGQGYKIRDLFINRPGESGVGLFGLVAVSGVVADIDIVNASVTGWYAVGILVGWNHGTVSDSYAAGMVTGSWWVGGLVGRNEWSGHVSSCYSAGSVTGDEYIGGLVGSNGGSGAVSNCYSTGTVRGDAHVGGLVGHNCFDTGEGTVSDSFWNNQTSGQATSDGGTGKTTIEMKTVATFSGAGWNIVGVANPGTRNSSCTWNIVDGQSYPFLSWQS